MKNKVPEKLISLDKQINAMLANKTSHSKNIDIPKSITRKSKKALEDLLLNHDNSFAVEIYLENKNNMSKVAIKYRGASVTYAEMFSKVFEYANSFKALGINKGDEVPVMVSNCPEYVYILLALNLIGAKMNTIGTWFDEEYLKEIFESTKSSTLIVSDDVYEVAKQPLYESGNIKRVLMVSLTDSFIECNNGEKINPYSEIDEKYHDMTNKVDFYKNNETMPIIDVDDFLKIGKDYDGNVVEESTLEDPAIISYTSGTTKPGYPKACLHSNMNYLALSRFKKHDVSGMPQMKDLTVLAHLPSYTQTVLTTSYIDPLYLGCTVAPEPFFEYQFFPFSLLINKPNYSVETPGYLLYLAKLLNDDPYWKNINMNYFMLPTIVGEGNTPGEEKYLNKTFQNHKFGHDNILMKMMGFSISYGGGSTENGGVFVTLFKTLQEKLNKSILRKGNIGLLPLPFIETEILDENNKSCEPGKTGLLVINSPCNQIRYVNEEFNRGMSITDSAGKEWYNGGCYAVKEKGGGIRIVGRPSSNIKTLYGESVPLYKMEDAISCDTKNVLSVVIVKIVQDNITSYVCHVEKQPDSKVSDNKLIEQCKERLKAKIDMDALENIYIRIRSKEESFPLAPSGKRDISLLTAEGISDKCVPYYNNITDEMVIKKVHK